MGLAMSPDGILLIGIVLGVIVGLLAGIAFKKESK